MSLEIVPNLQKFLETMYTSSKNAKNKLKLAAKIELKESLEKSKDNKDAEEKSTQADSAIAMELMLLQQSIMQDSVESSLNERHDYGWKSDEFAFADKESITIGDSIQNKLK